jgi:hypothetical protein
MDKAEKAAEMSPEEQVIFQDVYLPAFIDKCASLGLTFPDQESLQAALETTALIKMSLAQNQGSAIKKANLALKEALGITAEPPAQVRDAAVAKSAAESLVHRPAVREALAAALLLEAAPAQ